MIDSDFMIDPRAVPVFCNSCGITQVAQLQENGLLQPFGLSEGDNCPACGENMSGEAM